MKENTTLAKSLNDIKNQAKLMETSLNAGHLLQALKHCSNFLNELRSSAFSPKDYYEMYMAVFDSLEVLSRHLLQSHDSKRARKHDSSFWTDLYEMVQYSGNIIPRLYMMVVVGTACMATQDPATKVIMKDMIEMCKGVQHPIRGLFLRHYLSQKTKNLLPIKTMDEFTDSVDFLITNFVEMNKLWVRLQHQGHSSERELRLQERKELKILVGSNLVRLSQVLDDFTLENFSPVRFYTLNLFPAITEQIIQCKDPLAQAYLIDVLVQIFPDEFHFATLDTLLNDTFMRLHPNLRKSDLVSKLVDRFVTYHKYEEENSVKNTSKDQAGKIETPSDDHIEKDLEELSLKAKIPLDLVFLSFWRFYSNLKSSSTALPPEEGIIILQSLIKLSLTFDVSNLENLDKIYQFCFEAHSEDSPEETSAGNPTEVDVLTQALWADLLTAPLEYHQSIKNLLRLPYFYALYNKIENPVLKRKLSMTIAEKLFSSQEALNEYNTTEELDDAFKYLMVLAQDSSTALSTSKDLKVQDTIKLGEEKFVSSEFLATQELVAKSLHFVTHRDEFKCLSNLLYVRKKFLNKNPDNIIYTYPTLVTRMTNLMRIAGFKRLKNKQDPEASQVDLMISSSFKNIALVLDELYQHHRQYNAELVLKLYLNLASVADQVRQENIAYELFSQCFVVYEESLIFSSHSSNTNPHESMGRSVSYQAVILIANRLATLRYFKKENYEALITKVTLYGSRLLKKQDQCRSIYYCAHLWWWCDVLIEGESPTVQDEKCQLADEVSQEQNTDRAEEGHGDDESGQAKSEAEEGDLNLYRDPKRVLECLQKALRVSDTCMDPYLLLKLFIEILNRCLIFNIYGNWLVDSRYLNGLIDLIKTNLANFEVNHLSQVDDEGQESKLLKRLEKYFERTLLYIRGQNESEDRFQGVVV